jgi:hypothetical protein
MKLRKKKWNRKDKLVSRCIHINAYMEFVYKLTWNIRMVGAHGHFFGLNKNNYSVKLILLKILIHNGIKFSNATHTDVLHVKEYFSIFNSTA